MRIILTGGGTGGHVIPNIAVIEELKERGNTEILYIGSKDGPEKAMMQKLGIRFKSVSCGKLRRYFSFKNFIDAFKLPIGFFQAKRILKKFAPDKVFSKGGFVSVPIVIAASRLKIPVIVHESDVTPGLANRICFRFAKKIYVSFEETLAYIDKKYLNKVEVTGPIVRKSILKGDKNKGYRFTGLDDSKKILLIMGGSQGAQQINELVWGNIGHLLKNFQVVHVTGKGNFNISLNKKGYRQYEYLDEELKDVYAISSMIVSRGGANSLFEIGALGLPSLIIPLGGAASRGDQIENARVFAKTHPTIVLEEEIDSDKFLEAIEKVDRLDRSEKQNVFTFFDI